MKKRLNLMAAVALLGLILVGVGGSEVFAAAAEKAEVAVREVGAAEHWEVTCDNGARVKLLAVGTTHPGPDPVAGNVKPVGGIWWVDPDGQPTEPYIDYLTSIEAGFPSTSFPNMECYEFVARISGQEVGVYDWSIFLCPPTGTGFQQVDSKIPPGMAYCVGQQAADLYVADVGLIVSPGPWNIVWESTRDAQGGWNTTIEENAHGGVQLEPPADKEGNAQVAVTHRLEHGTYQQVVLFAVDARGQELRFDRMTETETPAGKRASFTLSLPVADLKKLQLRTRAMEYARFKNVQLRPAPDPNFKPGTLSEEARHKVVEVGEAEGWKAPFQLAPEVAIAAVSKYYAENRLFGRWNPAGVPVNTGARLGPAVTDEQPGQTSYLFGLEVRPTQRSVRLRLETDPPSPAVSDEDLFNYRGMPRLMLNLEGLLWKRVTLPADATSCDVRIGMAGGDFEGQPLEAVRDAEGHWRPESVETPEGRIAVGPVEEKEGLARFEIKHTLKDLDLHAVVSSDEGKPLESEEASILLQADGLRTATVKVKGPASAIRKVRIVTRPFEWAVYRNVGLRPVTDGQ